MYNSPFRSALLVTLAVGLLVGCAPAVTPPPTQPPFAGDKPTVQTPVRATVRPANTRPANTPRPAATAAPREKSFKLQWKTDTGDIRYLGAAKDGTLYGFTRADSRTGLKYVVVSPKGEIAKLLDISEMRACNDSFMHREDFRNREAYTVLADGTLLCHVPNNSALLSITPDGKATLLEPWAGIPTDAHTFFANHDGVMHFYDIHGQLIAQVPLPEDQHFTRNRLYVDGKDFVFLTHAGQIVRFPIPEGLSLQERFISAITPWDEVYLTYRTYDAIGNFKGEATLQVGADGKVTTLAQNPWAKRIEPGAITPMPYVFYSPEREEIYAIEDVGYWHKLALINRNNTTLKVYQFPDEVNLGDAFVGNDGAVYVWGRSLQGKPQLSKYALAN